MKYFLAFSYNMHDSSVSIADETRVLLVLEAERFYREKKKCCSHAEMELLIAEALRHVGITIDDVEAVACTAYLNLHLPEGERDIEWVKRHEVTIAGRRFDSWVINHHLAHAAIVYGFEDVTDVAIDVVDGGGDFGDTHRIYRYRDGRIQMLPNAAVHNRFSSRFYDVVSRHIYGSIMNEGKLMALAVMGKPRADMLKLLREHLEDFHRWPGEKSRALLERSFPVAHYQSDQQAYDLAASTQALFEELRVESVRELPTDSPQVLLSGGGTLNILANSRVKQDLGQRQLLIPPCCDDTGQSLGALLYLCHEKHGVPVTARMPFLGYSDDMAEPSLSAKDVLPQFVDALCANGVAFLHHGQSEIGPRALGHRSILALPSERNHALINNVIKGREFYRPVAPIIPLECVSEWFEWEGESRYMLFSALARPKTWQYAQGVCHYDGTARVQTVDAKDQPFLHRLLKDVGEATGCPILINTSLNPRGAPITSKRAETQAFREQHPRLPIQIIAGG